MSTFELPPAIPDYSQLCLQVLTQVCRNGKCPHFYVVDSVFLEHVSSHAKMPGQKLQEAKSEGSEAVDKVDGLD